MIEEVIDLGKDAVQVGGKAVVNKDLVIANKAKLMIAELNSDSTLAKIIRPLILLTGIFIIIMEIFGIRIGILNWMEVAEAVINQSTTMMEFYLVTWAGVAGTYVYNRTQEKKYTATITAQKLQRIKEEEEALKLQVKMNKEVVKDTRKSNRKKRKKWK